MGISTTRPGAADLRLDRVSKHFGSGQRRIVAVDRLSLDVPAGSALAVLGASGSGKSTLLHLIGGMDRPDGGSIHLGAEEIGGLSRRGMDRHRRRVGMLFQRFHLLPALSALDNVMVPLLAVRDRGDRVGRARAALAAVGLSGRERSLPAELSGGQQQRVGLARAIVVEPTLLLADEPTGNLDSTTGRAIMDLLMDLRHRFGATMIVVTHDREVASYCDRSVHLRDGRLVDSSRRS